jgi:putative endonuclease
LRLQLDPVVADRRIETPGTDIPVRFSTGCPVSSGCPQAVKPACGPPPPAATLEPEVMAMRAKDVLGKAGELAAADYLESCGLRILDRNWRSADGEIDIVAVERQVLVVCEVKSRTSTRYGTPLEAVSRAKRARLRRLAVQWLNAHGVRFDQVRIDVVGLVYEGTGGFTIEHIRAVG